MTDSPLVTTSILGVPNVSVQVQNLDRDGDPFNSMRMAGRRFASQGAREITLIPDRTGTGWVEASND